jgi:hypothetical protein
MTKHAVPTHGISEWHAFCTILEAREATERRQEANSTQRTTKITRQGAKFSRHSNFAPWICAPLHQVNKQHKVRDVKRNVSFVA